MWWKIYAHMQALYTLSHMHNNNINYFIILPKHELVSCNTEPLLIIIKIIWRQEAGQCYTRLFTDTSLDCFIKCQNYSQTDIVLEYVVPCSKT